MAALDKTADLAGPGIGDYAELEQILPDDYTPLLTPNETQRALAAVKRHIEDGLCRELDLIRVEVPLIVDAASGVNDYLDRDGSRTPVHFHIANDHGKHPIDARGRAGGDEVEADGARAVRHAARRGARHRHARRPQGLLPRPRPQRLRRPVGLGARDHARSSGRCPSSPRSCGRSGG